MIFIIPGGDRAAEAIAVCAEHAREACEVPAGDVLRGHQFACESLDERSQNWAQKTVCFWGHGSVKGDALLCKRGGGLINAGNVHLLADTAGIFAVACHAARVLGPAAIEKGVPFFIGFANQFQTLTEQSKNITAKYPVFSEPLKRYRGSGDWQALARDSEGALLQFLMDGADRTGMKIVALLWLLLNLGTGQRPPELSQSWDGHSELIQEGLAMLYYGSQNLCNLRVLPALTLPVRPSSSAA